MLEFINQEANITTTENGAATYASTNSYCLDLFATIGALRNSYEDEIVSRFIRAYAENADLAMKILFFARDIRGGLGERRVFRVILSWLAENEPYSVRQNLAYIARVWALRRLPGADGYSLRAGNAGSFEGTI